jgi:putative nucleotidyltransferase with HDIG domain
MLQTISTNQLRPGMFLHGMDRAWLDHSFWKKSFLLDARDIEKIVASGIQSVVVDTDKGLGPEMPVAPDVNVPSERINEPPPDEQVMVTVSPPGATARTLLDDELKHAKRLFASGCDQMKLVFQQARMGKAVSANAIMPLVEAISASVMRNPHALTSVARLKHHDGYTYMHSVAVCALMTALACELKLDEHMIRDAGAAGLMHDLGKAFMPLAVLNKPDKLSVEELEVARRHPQAGWDLLKSSDVALRVREVVLHHHEKYDGAGYPHRLKGDDIPLLARMGAVCDVYDALTSDRPYKAAWHPTQALRTMSLPTVKTFSSTKSNQPVIPRVVNLEKREGSDRILAIEDPRQWNFQHLTDLWLNHRSS